MNAIELNGTATLKAFRMGSETIDSEPIPVGDATLIFDDVAARDVAPLFDDPEVFESVFWNPDGQPAIALNLGAIPIEYREFQDCYSIRAEVDRRRAARVGTIKVNARAQDVKGWSFVVQPERRVRLTVKVRVRDPGRDYLYAMSQAIKRELVVVLTPDKGARPLPAQSALQIAATGRRANDEETTP